MIVPTLWLQNESTEAQDTRNVLHMLGKANISKPHGTSIMCEDQLWNSCSGIPDMAQKTEVYLPGKCLVQW